MKCNPTFDVVVDRDIVQCKNVKTFVPEMPCSSSFCAVLHVYGIRPCSAHPHPLTQGSLARPHPQCQSMKPRTPRGPTPSPSTAVRQRGHWPLRGRDRVCDCVSRDLLV